MKLRKLPQDRLRELREDALRLVRLRATYRRKGRKGADRLEVFTTELALRRSEEIPGVAVEVCYQHHGFIWTAPVADFLARYELVEPSPAPSFAGRGPL